MCHQKFIKSHENRSKRGSYEIERPRIVQISNKNWRVFWCFFQILSKTSEMAKKCIFWAQLIITFGFWINCQISINFNAIFRFCLCRTIVSEKVHIFVGHQNQAKKSQNLPNSPLLPEIFCQEKGPRKAWKAVN